MAFSQDSEDLTRVGPGTPMGEFMRQYWMPFAASSELNADGAPVRIMLLGEKLIAFRDSSGRVGLMDHRCPHRCASLFLGRNEEDGLRCIYHGWKFDVDGNCVDMPSVPAHQDFKDKVHAKAYKTYERNGLVWAYLGPREQAPAQPQIEVMDLPESDVNILFMQRSCNWLQALEGDIDTSHAGFLHSGHVDPDDLPETHPNYYTLKNRAPEFRVTDTAFGTSYGAFRLAKPGTMYWRVANFLFPFWSQAPATSFDRNIHARAWVPMDDTHSMMIQVFWKGAGGGGSAGAAKKDGTFVKYRSGVEYLPDTTDWYGRWRVSDNESTDWRLDRQSMKDGSQYSGIDNIHLQDQAVTESMGPITDHSFEHLAPSDQMIARTRRRILRAVRAFNEQSVTPPGVDNNDVYLTARSGYFFADVDTDWQDAYRDQIVGAVQPAQPLRPS